MPRSDLSPHPSHPLFTLSPFFRAPVPPSSFPEPHSRPSLLLFSLFSLLRGRPVVLFFFFSFFPSALSYTFASSSRRYNLTPRILSSSVVSIILSRHSLLFFPSPFFPSLSFFFPRPTLSSLLPFHPSFVFPFFHSLRIFFLRRPSFNTFFLLSPTFALLSPSPAKETDSKVTMKNSSNLSKKVSPSGVRSPEGVGI